MSVTDLTQTQQKLFNELKKTYKKCEVSGIKFINIYNSLYAFDSKNIESSTDIKRDDNIDFCEFYTKNKIENIPSSWVDCDVRLILTEKGKKELE